MDTQSIDDPGRTAPRWPFLGPPEGPDELGRLGQYRILGLLGEGGMGIVFRAEDARLRRPAALKVMRPELAAQDRARARFLVEARAAAALKHDHIVTIYQVGEHGDVPFLAMEYLAGRSLEEWLRPDRRAGVAEAVAIARQVARGLHAAHEAGLIHRDIKPANLWLEAPRGRVKILDFGLARQAAGELDALTRSGAVLGTPAFMAPEQARGEAIDRRADLFSLGCVLYRMVTGRLPFQGGTTYAVLLAVAHEEPPDVRALAPGVPPALAALIGRLLAKRPEDRPPDARAVLAELRRIEGDPGRPGPAPSDGAGPEPATVTAGAAPPGRVPGRWLLGLGGSAALACAAWFAFAPRGERPEAAAIPPAAPAGDASPADAPAGPVDLMALIDLDRDRRRGDWLRPGEGSIRGFASSEQDPLFYLSIPWDPPASYRLRFRVERVKNGAGQFAVALGCEDARFNMIFDLPARGALYTALGNDGALMSDRPDAHVGPALPDGVPMAVSITVRPGEVDVSLNGSPFYSWRGDLSRFSRLAQQTSEPLQVGGIYPGDFAVEGLVLEPLGPDAGRPRFDDPVAGPLGSPGGGPASPGTSPAPLPPPR